MGRLVWDSAQVIPIPSIVCTRVCKWTNGGIHHERCQSELHLGSLSRVVVAGRICLETWHNRFWTKTWIQKLNVSLCIWRTWSDCGIIYKYGFHSVQLKRSFEGDVFWVNSVSQCGGGIADRSRGASDCHWHESRGIDKVTAECVRNWRGDYCKCSVRKRKSAWFVWIELVCFIDQNWLIDGHVRCIDAWVLDCKSKRPLALNWRANTSLSSHGNYIVLGCWPR